MGKGRVGASLFIQHGRERGRAEFRMRGQWKGVDRRGNYGDNRRSHNRHEAFIEGENGGDGPSHSPSHATAEGAHGTRGGGDKRRRGGLWYQ